MKIAGYLALLLTWTLWIRTISPSSDTWSAAPGLASEDKCLASVKDKLDMWKQLDCAPSTGEFSARIEGSMIGSFS